MQLFYRKHYDSNVLQLAVQSYWKEFPLESVLWKICDKGLSLYPLSIIEHSWYMLQEPSWTRKGSVFHFSFHHRRRTQRFHNQIPVHFTSNCIFDSTCEFHGQSWAQNYGWYPFASPHYQMLPLQPLILHHLLHHLIQQVVNEHPITITWAATVASWFHLIFSRSLMLPWNSTNSASSFCSGSPT